jgi:hypothetical protein
VYGPFTVILEGHETRSSHEGGDLPQLPRRRIEITGFWCIVTGAMESKGLPTPSPSPAGDKSFFDHKAMSRDISTISFDPEDERRLHGSFKVVSMESQLTAREGVDGDGAPLQESERRLGLVL